MKVLVVMTCGRRKLKVAAEICGYGHWVMRDKWIPVKTIKIEKGMANVDTLSNPVRTNELKVCIQPDSFPGLDKYYNDYSKKYGLENYGVPDAETFDNQHPVHLKKQAEIREKHERIRQELEKQLKQGWRELKQLKQNISSGGSDPSSGGSSSSSGGSGPLSGGSGAPSGPGSSPSGGHTSGTGQPASGSGQRSGTTGNDSSSRKGGLISIALFLLCAMLVSIGCVKSVSSPFRLAGLDDASNPNVPCRPELWFLVIFIPAGVLGLHKADVLDVSKILPEKLVGILPQMFQNKSTEIDYELAPKRPKAPRIRPKRKRRKQETQDQPLWFWVVVIMLGSGIVITACCALYYCLKNESFDEEEDIDLEMGYRYSRRRVRRSYRY